jgi:hypothetical protein
MIDLARAIAPARPISLAQPISLAWPISLARAIALAQPIALAWARSCAWHDNTRRAPADRLGVFRDATPKKRAKAPLRDAGK